MSDATFRYPSSRWLLRRLLWAYGYSTFPTLRTSQRVYKDGGKSRRTPHSDAAFLADALDLLSTGTEKEARERMHSGRAEKTAAWLQPKLHEYDRLAAELNAEAPLAAGGRLAAIPGIRVLMYRLTTPLAALAAQPGMLRPGELVWAARPAAFNEYMDNLIRAACPGESLEVCYAAISEAAREGSPGQRGVSTKTMVGWRTAVPGDRFRFKALVRGVRAAAGLAELDPNEEALRARWLATASRLLGRLGDWLANDTQGEPLIDDIRDSFGHVTWASANTFADPALSIHEVAGLVDNPLFRSGALTGVSILDAVNRFAAAEGLDQVSEPAMFEALLQRLVEDSGLAARLSEAFRKAALRGPPPHTLARALHPSLRQPAQDRKIRLNLLLDDHVAAWADTSEHLLWWHRRLKRLEGLGHDGRLVGEFLVGMADAARRRLAPVQAAIEREGPDSALAAVFGEMLTGVRRHQAEQLVGGGVPLELAETRFGPLAAIAPDDPTFAGRLRALEALRHGRVGDAVRERIAAFRAARGSPDRSAELAQALAAMLEELGQRIMGDGVTLEELQVALPPAVRLLLGLGKDRPADRRFLKCRAGGLFALDRALRSSTQVGGGFPADFLRELIEDLEEWAAETPENGIAHALLADGYDLLGDRGNAVEHAKEAAKLGYPGYWDRLRR